MATTSPDNIRTQDLDDPYQPVADAATTANDIQAAFIRRANSYVGTSAQRTAFTDAVAGVEWRDTDGSQAKYRYTGSTWLMLGDKFYSGTGAQRTAFTSAPEGAQWRDTDGEFREWVRRGGNWVVAGDEFLDISTLVVRSGYTVDTTISYVRRNNVSRIAYMYVALSRATAIEHNTTLFTLPTGWRARGTTAFPVVTSSPSAGLNYGQTTTSGDVAIWLPVTSNATRIWFTGEYRLPAL